MAVKDRRLNLRTSSVQEECLRRAAEVTNSSVSQFVLESAVERAARVLADQRLFVLGMDDFSRVEELLAQPADFSRLGTLFAEETPFGKEFSFGR